MFPSVETSQLICFANQLTGFYIMRTLVVKGLIKVDFVTEVFHRFFPEFCSSRTFPMLVVNCLAF